jgi:hypothetical protein
MAQTAGNVAEVNAVRMSSQQQKLTKRNVNSSLSQKQGQKNNLLQVNSAYGNQQNGNLHVPAIPGGHQTIKGYHEGNANSAQTTQYLRNIKFIHHDVLGGTLNNS